jgi:hypothetical protein
LMKKMGQNLRLNLSLVWQEWTLSNPWKWPAGRERNISKTQFSNVPMVLIIRA